MDGEIPGGMVFIVITITIAQLMKYWVCIVVLLR
jgi:hypothetical protein